MRYPEGIGRSVLNFRLCRISGRWIFPYPTRFPASVGFFLFGMGFLMDFFVVKTIFDPIFLGFLDFETFSWAFFSDFFRVSPQSDRGERETRMFDQALRPKARYAGSAVAGGSFMRRGRRSTCADETGSRRSTYPADATLCGSRSWVDFEWLPSSGDDLVGGAAHYPPRRPFGNRS